MNSRWKDDKFRNGIEILDVTLVSCRSGLGLPGTKVNVAVAARSVRARETKIRFLTRVRGLGLLSSACGHYYIYLTSDPGQYILLSTRI